MNGELQKLCPISLDPFTMDSPHTKAHLLLQSHFCRNPLPMADYHTDTKSVLDQAIRILQAMVDISADSGWLATTLRVQTLLQMTVQGRWHRDPSLLCLPHVEVDTVADVRRAVGSARSASGGGGGNKARGGGGGGAVGLPELVHSNGE